MRYYRGKNKIVGDLEYTSISGKESYEVFKKNKTPDFEGHLAFFKHYGTVVNTFFKILAEKVVESERGVFIEGLGYFGICMYPDKINPKTMTSKGLQTIINYKTDNITYTLAFVPINKENSTKNWVMDSSFSRKIKSKLKRALNSGKKYMFTPSFYMHKYSKNDNN